MSKKEVKVFDILSEGFGLYFRNIKKFLYYMSFPVLGQVLGLLLIFGLTFIYTINLPKLISNYKFFDNFTVLVICSILVAIPGLIILLKAFWDFLVAYGAVNSMVAALVKTGKLYDFPAHTQVITRRTPSYILLWLLYSIFILLSVNIIFWVVGFIFFIYFSLIFQVFTLEEASPLDSFRRSFKLVKGNFAKTLAIITVLFLVTYIMLPQIFTYLLDLIKGVGFLALLIQGWVAQMPFDTVNSFLLSLNLAAITPLVVAQGLVSFIIAQIIVQYTLPLRSICLCLWYRELKKSEDKLSKKKSKISELQE